MTLKSFTKIFEYRYHMNINFLNTDLLMEDGNGSHELKIEYNKNMFVVILIIIYDLV